MPDENIREMWSDDELDTALAALRSDVDTDPRLLARTRTELLVGAGAADPAAVPKPAATRPWYRRRFAASAAAVVVVAAGILVVQAVRPDGGQPVAQAAAARALNSAADRIGASDEPLGPGQYRYVATHAWSMSTYVLPERSFSVLMEGVAETWVPTDERQEWVTRSHDTGNRKWVVGTEAEARAAGVPIEEPGPPEETRRRCGALGCRAPGNWQAPTEQFMAGLPRDPDRLYAALRAATTDRGPTPDLEMVVYAADMLRSGLVPADLRAALYRALAKVPALDVTEKFANLDGRKGIALGVTGKGMRHDVIIDPASGAFIGEREVAVDDLDHLPAGTIMSYTSVTTGVVDHVGDEPTG